MTQLTNKDGIDPSIIKRAVQDVVAKNWFNLSFVSLNIRQWLVLFAMGLVVIAIEVRSHANMWLEHNSGQTIWTDAELIWEIILFGLVIPILGGIFLGYIDRRTEERDRIAKELGLRQKLVRQISQARHLDEIIELIVKMPGMLVTADRTWMLAQQSGEKDLVQIANWERIEEKLLPPSEPVFPAVCESCIEFTSLNRTKLLTCPLSGPDRNDLYYTRHCFQLASDAAHRSVLLFDVPIDHSLTTDQMKLLNDLGPEISLALENANLTLNEQRQVDVARNERLRIARDLHDTLGQNVSYLRLQLEQLNSSRLASNSDEFQVLLANMALVADEAYEQVRDTLEELRTTEDQDLQESIRSFASQTGERANFAVVVHASGEVGYLSRRQNRQIMYILREILNNVEKHAGAQNVDIHLQWNDGEFRLSVRDDGKGFDPQESRHGDRYGLVIMKERSRTINADLIINAIPGKGTEVILILPLSPNASSILKS